VECVGETERLPVPEEGILATAQTLATGQCNAGERAVYRDALAASHDLTKERKARTIYKAFKQHKRETGAVLLCVCVLPDTDLTRSIMCQRVHRASNKTNRRITGTTLRKEK
jgi:hypothetical protein